MDPLTHSFVGIASAKAGLERLSPWTITACLLAANAPDIDVVAGFGGRWAALHYHRGITHSVVGTVALGIAIPSLLFLINKLSARVRRHSAAVRYRGLLIASLIAAATHPILDWTNNYGIRLLLPWNSRWFYGDLVFIVDPYIWLIIGGAAFLLTSQGRAKLIIWAAIAILTSLIVFAASASATQGIGNLWPARIIWTFAIVALANARWRRIDQRIGAAAARGAFALLLVYWGALGWQHANAYRRGEEIAQRVAEQQGEQLNRAAAMPVAANPFSWLFVAETNSATYRFLISSTGSSSPQVSRFEKPSGRAAELVGTAARDPRARILLEFARFPVEQIEDSDCISQTLVEFADLRYTQPQTRARGNFALNVPVDCPDR